MKFVPKGWINNIPALVQIMAWRRPGDKPLSETMLVRLLTHICVTRPQWVNTAKYTKCKYCVTCPPYFNQLSLWTYSISFMWVSHAHLSLDSPSINDLIATKCNSDALLMYWWYVLNHELVNYWNNIIWLQAFWPIANYLTRYETMLLRPLPVSEDIILMTECKTAVSLKGMIIYVYI